MKKKFILDLINGGRGLDIVDNDTDMSEKGKEKIPPQEAPNASHTRGKKRSIEKPANSTRPRKKRSSDSVKSSKRSAGKGDAQPKGQKEPNQN